MCPCVRHVPCWLNSQLQGWVHVLAFLNKETCRIHGIPQKGPGLVSSVLVETPVGT